MVTVGSFACDSTMPEQRAMPVKKQAATVTPKTFNGFDLEALQGIYRRVVSKGFFGMKLSTAPLPSMDPAASFRFLGGLLGAG